MKNKEKPYIIDFAKIGISDIGYISVIENSGLPFKIERVFWTYYTPESVVRGRHAHYKLEQVLIAVSGRLIVETECFDSKCVSFELTSPNTGLYIPPSCWHTMRFSHNAVLLSLSSTEYNESDYIRDYETFKKMRNNE